MSKEGNIPSDEDKAQWWRCLEDAQTRYDMDAEEARVLCHDYSQVWYDAAHGTWRQVKN